jgi:pimeloyl-ACP methyl ester carboxylesterase
MPKVLFNGINLWYDIQGKGDPLTLIGGYGLLHNQWDFVNSYLLEHHQVIHWNYRGAGNSDWTMTEPCTIEQWVDDLNAILNAAGIEKTNIWSTSTGSFIGIRFAGKYPERTKALITYPQFRADQTWKDIMRVSYEVARTYGIYSLARLYAGVVLPPDVLYTKTGINFEQFEAHYFEKNVNMLTLEAHVNAYANADLTGDVKRLTCPTLLLMGNESRLNEEASLLAVGFNALVNAFKALKPDAEVAPIEGAGSTYCMITKPEETARIVIDYLKRVNKR